MNAQKFRLVLVGLILVTLTVTGVVGYLGTTYLQAQITAANHLRIEAEVNNSAGAAIAQAERQFEDPRVSRLFEYLQQLVPNSSYREQFVADATKYAEASGVELTSINFTEPTGGSGPAAVPKIAGATPQVVSLTFGTSMRYENFITFVKKLENNLQHIQVLTLNIQPSGADRGVLASSALTIALYVKQGT